MTEKVSGVAPLTSAERAALRELAEVANKIWKGGWAGEIEMPNAFHYSAAGRAFIAGASPSTILSLLDENEELRRLIRRMLDHDIGARSAARAALSEEAKEARDG